MKQCDLIMKGGVTSGVVYPKLITQLAKEYRLKSVGGTSAGAIGAGFSAAAEYNRQVNASNAGFEVLNQIPQTLGGDNLLNLFDADPVHKKTLSSLLKVFKKGGLGWNFSSGLAVYRAFKSIKKLPATYYGMCSGLSQNNSGNVALTDWMNFNIEKIAGRLVGDTGLPDIPLTFGMLEEDAGVRLRTITTNVSQGVPEMLPYVEKGRLVKKSDLERLMPQNIVEYIKSKQEEDLGEFYELPIGKDMPVLIGMRLSLSFPVLLSAFPIYKYDYSLAVHCPEQTKVPKLCWYSDGGITSNFPIHLFDNPFPSRPTFGVLLTEYDQCRYGADSPQGAGENRIFLPTGAGQGMTVPVKGVNGLFQFIYSIFQAAQNWQDATQSKLPGYKERIVRIALNDDKEGGLNLNMADEVIQSLSNLGNLGGEKLIKNFDFDEHKWRRVVNAYSAIESAFTEIVRSYQPSQEINESMSEFLDRYIEHYDTPQQPAESYDPKDIQKVIELKRRLDDLMALADAWNEPSLKDNWRNGGSMPDQAELKITPNKFSKGAEQDGD